MIIRVIVYAHDEQEAMENARQVFEGLCENQDPFDYYTTFDEDKPMSGKNRWGELPVVVKVCTRHGSEECDTCKERFKCYTTKIIDLVHEGMEATKQEFFKHLVDIKHGFATKSDIELFEDGMFKYYMYAAGREKGPSVYLYDQDGDGIADTEHLDNVLNKWQCNYEEGEENPYSDMDMFVIPADVHY
jgi:hypothetical protein